jgi:alpha-N-arabinofuranosidase
MQPEEYAREYRRFSTYLRDFSGTRLYLIGCGPNGNDPDWTRRFFTALGGYRRIHGWGAHYYCGTAGTATEYTDSQWYVLLEKATRMERLVVQQRAVLDSFDPERKVGLIVDEWGTWHPPAPGRNPKFLWQQNTLRDALVAALSLDIFNRHADKLVMANIAQTVNVLQAMVLTDDTGLVLTPTYHVFEMNKGHHDATAVPVHVVDRQAPYGLDGKQLELLSASASVKGDKALVSVTNLDPAASADVVLDLRGATVRAHRGRLLTAPELQAHNTAAEPAVVVPTALTEIAADSRGLRVTLPPHSFATIELDL